LFALGITVVQQLLVRDFLRDFGGEDEAPGRFGDKTSLPSLRL
jgi:hypothetical protein